MLDKLVGFFNLILMEVFESLPSVCIKAICEVIFMRFKTNFKVGGDDDDN